MDSLSLLPAPAPQPPPRTTSIQSNLSKLLQFAKNNKASHLSFHSKSFSLTKSSWSSSSLSSSTSSRSGNYKSGIIPLTEECTVEEEDVATAAAASESNSFALLNSKSEENAHQTKSRSTSRDSTPARASTSSSFNSPVVELPEEEEDRYCSDRKETNSNFTAMANSEGNVISNGGESICSTSAMGADGGMSGQDVSVRNKKSLSKQPRPKSDMFFVNPVVKTRQRPIGRSASRYSTLEVSARDRVMI